MKPEKSLRSRALDWLSRGEYSRVQLQQKLAKYSDDIDAINDLLEQLQQAGWQSDERFAEALIHSKSRRLGNRRLAQYLQQKGIDSECFQDALPSKEHQIDNALQVLIKKFKVFETDAQVQLKYKRFLAYRGFDMDVILAAIKMWQQDIEKTD